jgi:hypothetical protein
MNLCKKIIFITAVLTSMMLFSSCEKDEGEGGKGSIHGLVWEKRYNPTGTVINGEYPATYEDVFIVYGDNVSYGDKISTNHEGKFEFKYLQPGNYKVYVYSKDPNGDFEAAKTPVIKEVKISKDESVDAGTLTIYDYQQ